MELLKAVKMRRSIRAFKPDPVPKEIILELLGVATRAPSGVNSQPWEFFIISGKTLNNVRQAYVEQYRAGIVPNPDVTIPKVGKLAPKLQGVYKERQILLAKQIYDVYGVTKENTKALHEYNESMYRFLSGKGLARFLGRFPARFQPLPIGTAREVFPQAARPVVFVERVMSPCDADGHFHEYASTFCRGWIFQSQNNPSTP